MATFRSKGIIESHSSLRSCIFYLLLVSNLQLVASSATWTAPPPGFTQTDSNDIRIVDMSVVNGSTQVALRWNYTLSAGSNLISTTFYITTEDGNSDDIGIISPSAGAAVNNRNDYRTRFDISTSEVATLILKTVTEREEAVYQCRLAVLGNSWAYEINVTVIVPVNFTNVSSYNQTVLEGSNVTLLCRATGRPTPKIIWTRVLEDGTCSNGEVLHKGPIWNFPNISRITSGKYCCIADSGFGNLASHKVDVNVQYPAKIVELVSEHEVASQQKESLECQAEGNPQPTYSWTPCDPPQNACNESGLDFQASNESVYTFTCKVENDLDSDTGNTTVFIASDIINVTLVITNEDCSDGEYNQLWEKLKKMIDDIFTGVKGYESVELKSVTCGSVIVDLALKFRSTVRESEVLLTLRDAVKNGTFGDFNVSAIRGTRGPETPTTMATTPTGPSKSTTWIIVGVVLGVVFALAVAGCVAWYLHKKRKCKKRDTKVHNNGSPGEAGGNVQEETYDTAQTRNSGAAKEPPALPQYAVVDKSKKKPKKPKPGELQYAELAEFPAGQGGQRSSTSPTNRPTETQYAQVM